MEFEIKYKIVLDKDHFVLKQWQKYRCFWKIIKVFNTKKDAINWIFERTK